MTVPDETDNHTTMIKQTLTLSLALIAATSFAGPPAKPAPEVQKASSGYDRLWNALTIYEDKDASLFNSFRFVGRFQLDQYYVDSNLGTDEDWVIRRWRMGGKAVFFHNHLTAHVEADINTQNLGGVLYFPTTYQRLTDAYLGWKFCDAAILKVGKHSAPFTLDGGTSSTELITIDRNNLTNNLWFTYEYFSGVSLSGKVSKWQYNTGIFSGGSYYVPQTTFRGSSKEFGNLNGGNFGLASVGYDFAKDLGVKQALLRADVVYNDPDTNSNQTKKFSWIESLNFQLDAGRWGLRTDLTAGNGSLGQSDVWGAVVMPWFNITDRLQIVGRYTYLNSDDPKGVSFGRYENVEAVERDGLGNIKTDSLGKAKTLRGDEYNEAYVGLNYYFYGHKLKLQTGFTYAWMDDSSKGHPGKYDGWGITTGLRIAW